MDKHRMDDKRLDEIFGNIDVPSPTDNARKVAVNLAVGEFEALQKKSFKKPQGFSPATRLISKPGSNRRHKMKNAKFIYGGMATAMVLVLAAGVSFQQTGNVFKQGVEAESFAPQNSAPENVASVAATSGALIGAGPMTAPMTPPMAAPAVAARAEKAEMAADTAVAAAAPMEAARPMSQGIAADAMYMRRDVEIAPYYQEQNRDNFEHAEDNPVKAVTSDPVSTFSIDVDTSSYSFVRRRLNAGQWPQKDAVRVEEMVNYFDYNYPLPESKAQPFKPTVTVTPSPWQKDHKLIHIGIKGYDIAQTAKPHANLVFLIDTSGSMAEQDKLPLLVSSLKMLLQGLKPDDTVGIVTYAGNAGVALEPTKVSDSSKIINTLDNLMAGGGTAGAEGLRSAYQLAESHMDKNGVNRVILATDGDFNIGISDPKEMKDYIEQQRKSGIFLSVLGFGQGNYNDAMMQELAQNGNGTAAYIDNLNEARKVLVEEASSTLFTIAKDVKIQVEFNPATVAEYRLVGYETRALNREDFNNDKVDAGDIGSGHAVTAIYDITPVGAAKAVDDSRYAAKPAETHKADANFGGEYAFLKIRYKLPDGDTSKLITTPITAGDEKTFDSASPDVRFSTAVAGFAQLLKNGKYTGTLTYDDVINEAQGAKGADEFGYRGEFIQLVRMAKSLGAAPAPQPRPVLAPEDGPVAHPMGVE